MFNVNEIFYSVQGEGSRAGLPCVFVRLQGCKLRCTWCDTPYALDHRVAAHSMSANDIENAISQYSCSFVEFTGGEPLEQPAVIPFMKTLCDKGYTVAVETGGHVDISELDPRIVRIVDVKCPDSKMSTLNRFENLDLLQPNDEVKFVIASRADYEWAREIVQQHNLVHRVASVLMSPAFGIVEYLQLVTWILEDALPVRFQIQMHKHIWSPETRGV